MQNENHFPVTRLRAATSHTFPQKPETLNLTCGEHNCIKPHYSQFHSTMKQMDEAVIAYQSMRNLTKEISNDIDQNGRYVTNILNEMETKLNSISVFENRKKCR